MRLLWLAPEIQTELIYHPPTPTGRYPISEAEMRRIASFLSWGEQRAEWKRFKNLHGLR